MTLVGAGFSAELCRQASLELASDGISAEVVDLRVINPMDLHPVVESVSKTGRLLAVDGGYGPCGLASEIIASIVTSSMVPRMKSQPARITLPFAPAPTSAALERSFYPTVGDVVRRAGELVRS